MMGTGVSAAVAPGIPALRSWRSCLEAVLEAAEQLEVLHPGDVARFRRKVTKDRDLLVVAHDLIRKMSPVSLRRQALLGRGGGWLWARLANRSLWRLLPHEPVRVFSAEWAEEPGTFKSLRLPSP